MNVATPQAAAAKWVARSQAGAQTYGANVAASNVDWAGLTSGAQNTWSASVANAAANGYFASGVNDAGTAGWKAGVASKGVARYSPGVTAGQGKYTTKEAPYLTALQGLTLPARGVKGSNIGRVQAVDDLMQATKKSIG